MDGYYKDSTNCKTCTETGCKKCPGDVCSECEAGYCLQGTSCLSTFMTDCLTCSSDVFCLSCSSPKIVSYDSSSCVTSCQPNQSSNGTKCVDCDSSC